MVSAKMLTKFKRNTRYRHLPGEQSSKKYSFYSYFLENIKNHPNFTNRSNKFSKFLNFL